MREEIIGNARLILGDASDVIPTLGYIDAVISDPPYGDNDTHSGHLSTITLKNGSSRQPLGFNGMQQTECVEMARQWVSIARRWVVFTCEWKFIHAIDDAGLLVRFGIWRKPDGAPQFTGDRPGMGWEAVAICHRSGRKRWNGGGKHAFWNVPRADNNTGHPTGKPLALFRHFVDDFTEHGETVLDPYMGSGTTGVACAKLGRRFVGIEINEHYFTIACRRVEEAQRQADLFVSPPPAEDPADTRIPDLFAAAAE